VGRSAALVPASWDGCAGAGGRGRGKGFWKAVREVFPTTREQRCWFHVQANVLAALPKSAHPGAIAAMREIYNAEDIDKAQVAIKAFEIDYGAKYPKAVAKIVDNADVLLEFYKYPPSTGST
jgi:putative transposase